MYRILWFPSEEKDRIVERLRASLERMGARESDSRKCDYLFVVGGDGSFFHFAREWAFEEVKLVGINSGKVAFFLDFPPDELERLREASWQPLELLRLSAGGRDHYAVNDIYITGDLLLEARVSLDGQWLENFRGLSLLFATQYGSTGLNRSTGGPLLMPGNGLWLFGGLGPYNSSRGLSLSSPLVLHLPNRMGLEMAEGTKYRCHLDGKCQEISGPRLEISLVQAKAKVLELNVEKYEKKIGNIFSFSR